MKKIFLFISIIVIVYSIGYYYNILPEIKSIDDIKKIPTALKDLKNNNTSYYQNTIHEESSIVKAVEDTMPSVVTIGIIKTTNQGDLFTIDPFNFSNPFKKIPGKKNNIEQNIGSGFVVSDNGLIITNKHVVSDTEAAYKILTNDDKKYDVEKIYKDPLNDLALIKINAKNLKPLKLGDSSKLKLGQTTIAIGTPLGEFKNTVTSGIISGLGRGITAGSPFEGLVEKLDNVIQTDAAISPGNSGGPLLNIRGEVIGINTAVAQEGQNIGFAIPVNIVKKLIENFNQAGGKIEHPFIGIRYKMIDRQTAVLNNLPEGAYITEVIENSPAAKTNLQLEDIIIEFDGKRIQGSDDQALQKLVVNKKVGDKVKLKFWRNNEVKEIEISLSNFE